MGYKPHANVTSIHTALDALGAMLSEQQLAAGDIDAVEIGLSPDDVRAQRVGI